MSTTLDPLTADATYAGLMDALLRNPADDAPRLLLADWLDIDGPPECRDPARAEFIRVQCELARHRDPYAEPPGRKPSRPSPWGRDRQNWELYKSAMRKYQQGRLAYWNARAKGLALRGRERELFGPNHFRWWPILQGWVVRTDPSVRAPRPTTPIADVRRGFVARVECPLAAFLGGPCCGYEYSPDVTRIAHKGCIYCDGSGHTPGIAKELFAAQPVTEVRLADREPWHSHKGSYHWYDTARPYSGVHQESDLPTELWELLDEALFVNNKWQERMKVYPTADAARAALSAAAVRYGRTLAGVG